MPAGAVSQTEEAAEFGCPPQGWRRRLFIVIFESDTPAGRNFDIALLIVIVASLVVVMLESVEPMNGSVWQTFSVLEWVFTALFTLEYLARLSCVQHPLRYALSFFGIVDLLAVMPLYLAFAFPELHALVDVRILRLLRVFRILKLTAYIREYRILGRALRASGRKILIFISTVGLVVILLGTVMYVVEGPEHGFRSIPLSVYWAITTITTVGFGDITPQTDLGRAISSFMMLLGWGILAVPTGIVTAELAGERLGAGNFAAVRGEHRCAACGSVGHRADARYCQDCGTAFRPLDAPPPG
ncbi:MAG: ion transporter [Gammaproteobacteria bacterium]